VEPTVFWTWIAVVLQLLAAGAVAMWPDQKWIGFLVMAVGLVIAAVVGIVYLSSNFPDKYTEIKRVSFLLPIGLAIGLAVAWFVFRLYPNQDERFETNVALRLQFSDSITIPTERSNFNVKNWYSVFTASANVNFLSQEQLPVGRVSIPRIGIFLFFLIDQRIIARCWRLALAQTIQGVESWRTTTGGR
jgi:hypothetical protein